MYALRQSTASQEVSLGYFLDSTDGDTEETALTIANTDIKLHKTGATTLANKNSGGATHISNGIYYITLDATDTDTVGPMTIYVHVSGALVAKQECCVYEEAVYDAWFASGASGFLQPTVAGRTLDVTATGAAGIDWANVENQSTSVDLSATDIQLVDTCTTNTDVNTLIGTPAVDVSTDIAALDSRLSGLANVGAGANRPASSYVLTTGVQSANTYTSTQALDGIRHTHTSVGGALDLYYEFTLGSGSPISFKVTGYVTGINDDIPVYCYDWIASSWIQVGTITGTNSTSNSVYSFDAFVGMVGSGADLGKVRLRFYEPTTLTAATLAIDQLFVVFTQELSGYVNAAIWYNDSASNTNTAHQIDGVPSNPVSTEAAVLTLLTQESLNRIEISPGSTYTLSTTYASKIFNGHGASIALGGQSVNYCHFFDSETSGVATAANEMEFHDCEITGMSAQNAHFYNCGFNDTLALTLAGDYRLVDCYSGIPGASSPVFTKTAGQTITLEMRRWSGGITISGLEAGDVLTISGELGTVTLNGANGTVEIRGTYKSIVDNRTGSPVLNTDGAIKGVDVASILADTSEIGTAGAGLTDLGGMSTTMKAQVNAEVVDTLTTDTYAELGSVPSATSSLKDKIVWLFMLARNKFTQTATTATLRSDGDLADVATSTDSDDGTTAVRGEWT